MAAVKRFALVLMLVFAMPCATTAQTHNPHDLRFGRAVPEDPAVASAQGILNRVDANLRLVNLSHEAIPKFGWSAKITDLKLAEKQMAVGLQPGMQVKFKLRRVSHNAYVITEIAPVR